MRNEPTLFVLMLAFTLLAGVLWAGTPFGVLLVLVFGQTILGVGLAQKARFAPTVRVRRQASVELLMLRLVLAVFEVIVFAVIIANAAGDAVDERALSYAVVFVGAIGYLVGHRASIAGAVNYDAVGPVVREHHLQLGYFGLLGGAFLANRGIIGESLAMASYGGGLLLIGIVYEQTRLRRVLAVLSQAGVAVGGFVMWMQY